MLQRLSYYITSLEFICTSINKQKQLLIYLSQTMVQTNMSTIRADVYSSNVELYKIHTTQWLLPLVEPLYEMTYLLEQVQDLNLVQLIMSQSCYLYTNLHKTLLFYIFSIFSSILIYVKVCIIYNLAIVNLYSIPPPFLAILSINYIQPCDRVGWFFLFTFVFLFGHVLLQLDQFYSTVRQIILDVGSHRFSSLGLI